MSGDRLLTAAELAERTRGLDRLYAERDRESRSRSPCVSWARIGEHVGHGDIVTTARTYTHVLGDVAELDYAGLVLGD